MNKSDEEKINHLNISSLDIIFEDLKLEIEKDRLNCRQRNEVSLESEEKKKYLTDLIHNITLDIVTALSSDKEPSIIIRNQRVWSNCTFSDVLELKNCDSAIFLPVTYNSKKVNKDFAQIIFLLSKIYQLLMQDASSSRREVYYENLDLFEDQSQLDATADKVSCLLGVPQWEFGLLASSKGLVAGSLQIISSSFNMDCTVSGGTLIPSDLPVGIQMLSNAKFVLIVEKDSTFQKLYDEGFLDHHNPCIMVTGKGYPDVSTRLLVNIIRDQLAIPIFILVDSDPYGIEIMCIYKFGSLKQSHIGNRLAIPSAKWIGVHPTDMEDFNLNCQVLSTRDIHKAHCLLTRPYVVKDQNIKYQLNFLCNSGKKSEIEGISQISQGYLTDVYIPMKIKSKQFL